MSHLSETSELIEIGYRMAENGQMQILENIDP